MSSKRVLMQGNEACLEGALVAGMRFYAGYPITPSTEIAELAALRLPMEQGSFIQMEDEIASIAAIIGGSVAGVKSMTATSGPGFSLMQENIGYAAITETPCVIVNVQRGGPSTGLPTSPSQGDVMQAKWGTHGDHPIIVISPTSVLETYQLIIRCFNLSEKYRVPVIFLMDESVGHMREGIEIPDKSSIEIIDRKLPDEGDDTWLPYEADGKEMTPAIPPFGTGRKYHITGLIHDEHGYPTSNSEKTNKLINRLINKIENNRDDIITFEESIPENAKIAVVCFGGPARSVKRAITKAKEENIDVGLFRLITIWPFPEKQIAKLSEKVDHILVAELNNGQIVNEVKRCARHGCSVHHIGKIDGTILMPDEILAKIKEVI
ncbi:MAG: 2-oxoacid:acceptor oxidoreductase subunit alpha [Clostridia bacterium]|nr:2-oxoacid:acceptor oxidoreductase subunit alpha [Clostridia bacterium]